MPGKVGTAFTQDTYESLDVSLGVSVSVLPESESESEYVTVPLVAENPSLDVGVGLVT